MSIIITDYDPYKYREVEYPMSNFGAFTGVIKSSIGTAIVAAPMAFYNSGWLVGLFSTVLIGIIIVYAMHILLYGMYEMCKRQQVPILTYPEAMHVAVAGGPPYLRWMRKFMEFWVDLMLATYYFGSCCVYVVFIADCAKDVGDHYYKTLDSRVYMCLLIAPLCLISFLRNLKSLVPIAAVANFLVLFGFGIIFYYVFSALGSLADRSLFQDIRLFPIFFGTTLFSMNSLGLIVAIEANMANPQDYLGLRGILTYGMTIVIAVQALFGFFGYWRYGDEVRGSILQNLPGEEIWSALTRLIFALVILLSYPLYEYITVEVIWHRLLKAYISDYSEVGVEVFFRTCLVICSVLVALLCSDLSLIISLVGSMSLSCLGLIFPALFHICVRYESGYGPYKIYLIGALLLLVFGIAGCVFGTWITFDEIKKSYESSSEIGRIKKLLYVGLD